MPYAGHFQLTVEQSGATLHLRLMGEFDRAAVGRVENALDRIFKAPTARRVVFDLRRLIFLDAAGLRTILRANERARAGACELVVARPRGTANRVFTLTGAGRELSLVDEPEVMASVRPADQFASSSAETPTGPRPRASPSRAGPRRSARM